MGEDRYIRQVLLDQIGQEGQHKLSAAHVLIVGCGGLGSIAGPYLAGAGIGHITLIDGDAPELSNLHRQVFFASNSSQGSKASLLAEHIKKLNPSIEVESISKMLDKSNIILLEEADVVLECTDHVMTKYLVNDYCVVNQIPMVYGAIHKYDGYVSLFENQDKDSIHLRDAFPIPNIEVPTCSEVGVMGTLAGIIGLFQANEAIKYLSGAGKTLSGQLLTYNILENQQLKMQLRKSYLHDMSLLYEQNDYKMPLACSVPTLSYSSLIAERDRYQVISILENAEHKEIDDQILHDPLSNLNVAKYTRNTKETVFYCMSGRRSANLVQEILARDKSASVFSLEGGLTEVTNFKEQLKA